MASILFGIGCVCFSQIDSGTVNRSISFHGSWGLDHPLRMLFLLDPCWLILNPPWLMVNLRRLNYLGKINEVELLSPWDLQKRSEW